MVSVVFYWIIKELSDVTSLSYIMNNADPSEYSELLSKNNIFSWLWALVWLISSWVILAFNPFMAVSILVWIVAFFLVFINKYFDNYKEVFKINIDISQIKKFKFISASQTLESVKQYAIAQVQKTDFAEIAKTGVKFIFLKPIEIKKSVDWKEIITTTKKDIHNFIKILFKPPYSYRLLIFASIFVFFGFWDTFVTSFLIDFLDKVLENSRWELQSVYLANVMTSYVFIALLAIPAYWAQLPFIKLSKKLWTFGVILFWVLISWISLMFFWVFWTFWVILMLWLVNSFGYAAAMPLSQWEFCDEYNLVYSQKNNLSEIDSNASSAPLKMLSNLANVWGLFLGWILVWIFWYTFTFVIFGLILIWIFTTSIIKRKEWKL